MYPQPLAMQDIGGYYILDAEESMANNPDFDMYRKQQEYRSVGQDTRARKDGENVCKLGRYLFLRVLEKTY